MLMYEKARSGHGPLSPHSDNSTDDLQVPDLHPPITIDDDDDDILEPNSILPQHTATANRKPSISCNHPTANDTDTGSSIPRQHSPRSPFSTRPRKQLFGGIHVMSQSHGLPGLTGLGLAADALAAATSHQHGKVGFEADTLAMGTSFDESVALSQRLSQRPGLLEQLIAGHGHGHGSTGASGVASELMANYNRDSINSIDPAAGTGSLPNGIDDMSGIAIPGWSLAAQSTVIAGTGLQGIREDAGESQCVPSHCVASSPPPATSANHPCRQIVVTRTGRIAGTVTKQGGPAAETMADSAMHPGVKTSGMGAGKSQRRNRSKALLSPLPIPHGSTLPLDHQPARGRGRAQQLRMMTQDQIKVEAIARGEKNRKAARDARLRKKQHTEILEARVRELEAREAESQKFICQLQNKIRQLELGFQ